MANTTTDTPERTCVGCRTKRPVTQLVRLTRHDGSVAVGRASDGRGAWICRSSSSCIDQALRRRALQRAWRTTFDQDQLEQLETVIRDALEGTGTTTAPQVSS